ncbi:hypothetical protein [Bauldia sp.]|uniref:hypothetical protein n=1 Tax=Bauldia sp. TaxID=2575872 RepID=UPI003BABCA73
MLRTIDMPGLPPGSWLMDYRRDGVVLYRGSLVEGGDDWFAEGAWAGDFSKTGMLGSSFRCGSGAALKGQRLIVAPPSHSLEAIYCFRFASQPRWLISNSFACLSAAAPNSDLALPMFAAVEARAKTIKDGIGTYERVLHRARSGTFFRLAFSRFRLRLNRDTPVETILRPPALFVDYDDYVERLAAIARSIIANAAAPQRRHPFGRIVSSISGGYDSPAVTAIVKQLGDIETVSLSTARGGRDDSGAHIAAMWNIPCHEYTRFATAIETRGVGGRFVNPADVDLTTLPEVDAFLGAITTPEDAIFAPFAPHLQGAVYFTGVHGDRMWAAKASRDPNITRPDVAGSGLDEFRKRLGFVHVPLAFYGAQNVRRVRKISRSDEMAPFSVGGKYDRPIPRRIVESAGVPREAFGNRKNAGSVLFRFTPQERHQFHNDLVERYRDALKDVVARLQPRPRWAWRRRF